MSVPPPSHHANLDIARRRLKAQKLVALLERRRRLHGAHLLDIGTGAGVIADALAEAAGPDGHVDSVDVVDVRVVRDTYTFHRLADVALPFDDATFDAVISNHVVEHVGARADQAAHLAEIARTLRPGGVAYVAFPNRFGLVEPHFRLPLLGWLPPRLQDRYVRVARGAAVYDCRLLSWSDFRELAAGAGLLVEDCTLEAVQFVRDIESPHGPARLLMSAPTALLRPVRLASPTFVTILRLRND